MNLIEQFKDKNVLLESHCDLDGIGSIILYKYFIESYTKSSMIYSSDYPDMEIFDENKYKFNDIIIFTDIAPSVELYNQLKKLNKEKIQYYI